MRRFHASTVLLKISNARKQQAGDLVDRLLECHERIRRFIALAREVGKRPDAPGQETIEACQAVERYFTEALPLHVADEEQSILPRLQACSSEVIQALATMQQQHAAHEPMLCVLLQALTAVRGAPGETSRHAALVSAAVELEAEFAQHLALEESVIFPAIREALTPETQDAISQEQRMRREERAGQ